MRSHNKYTVVCFVFSFLILIYYSFSVFYTMLNFRSGLIFFKYIYLILSISHSILNATKNAFSEKKEYLYGKKQLSYDKRSDLRSLFLHQLK